MCWQLHEEGHLGEGEAGAGESEGVKEAKKVGGQKSVSLLFLDDDATTRGPLAFRPSSHVEAVPPCPRGRNLTMWGVVVMTWLTGGGRGAKAGEAPEDEGQEEDTGRLLPNLDLNPNLNPTCNPDADPDRLPPPFPEPRPRPRPQPQR